MSKQTERSIYMKKRNVAAMILAGCAAVMTYSVGYAAELNVSYGAGDNSLILNGSTDEREYLNIVITSDDIEISDNMFSGNNLIVRTVTGNTDGTIDSKIEFPQSMDGVRLFYTITNENVNKRGVIQSVDKSRLSALSARANSADRSAMINIIKEIDSGNSEVDPSYSAGVLQASKPSGGYTAESFINTYMLSEMSASVKTGKLSFAQAAEQYSAYLDKNIYQLIQNLDENSADSMGKAFISESGNINRALQNSVFYINCKNSKGVSELKQLVLDYLGISGINSSVYNSISNNYYKEKVFTKLFDQRSKFSGASDIVSRFNTAAEECKKESDKAADSSQGGGSGGGGSSGGGSSSGGTWASPYVPEDIRNNQIKETMPPVYSGPFSDIAGHWAEQEILSAYDNSIVHGMGDGTFCPDNKVTRAEFVTMITNMLDINQEAECAFNDVSKDAWYYKSVAAASNAGYIVGDGNRFNPETNITREDAAVIISRILADKNIELNSDAEYNFTDASDAAEYSKQAIAGLTDKGIISGYDGKFNPKGNTTRAESAALLLRVFRLFN